MKSNSLSKIGVMLVVLTMLVVMVCAQAQGATTWYSGGKTYAWTVGETGGEMTKIGPTIEDGWSGVAYSAGYLYAARYYAGTISRINTTTGLLDAAWQVTGVGNPTGIRFGPGGYLYAADTGHGKILKIDVGTMATTDLMPTPLDPWLYDVAFDATGANAYVTAENGTGHHVYKYDTTTWTKVAGFDITDAGFAYGIAVGPTDGMIYVSDYYGGSYGEGIIRYSAAGVRDNTWIPAYDWNYTKGLTFGPDGLLYIAADDLCMQSIDPAAPGTLIQFASQTVAGAWSDNPAFVTFKAGGPVTVHVDLPDYSGPKSLIPIGIEFIQGGSVVRTDRVFLDESNNATVNDVNLGNYNIAFTACKCLRQVVQNVTVTDPGPIEVIVTLVNGDVNGDTEITTTDLSVVLSNL